MGVNLGLDLIGIIPGLGALKGAKAIKTVKTVSKLSKAAKSADTSTDVTKAVKAIASASDKGKNFVLKVAHVAPNAAGIYYGANAIPDIVENGMTPENAQQLVGALSGVANLAKSYIVPKQMIVKSNEYKPEDSWKNTQDKVVVNVSTPKTYEKSMIDAAPEVKTLQEAKAYFTPQSIKSVEDVMSNLNKYGRTYATPFLTKNIISPHTHWSSYLTAPHKTVIGTIGNEEYEKEPIYIEMYPSYKHGGILKMANGSKSG